MEQLVHDLQVECPAGSIPEKLLVSVNQLKLNDTITIAQIELPAKAKVLGDPETVVVSRISFPSRSRKPRPGRRRGRARGYRGQKGRGRGGIAACWRWPDSVPIRCLRGCPA